MTGFRISIDPRELAYCQMADCGVPLLYLFDQKKRRYCYACTQTLLPVAKEILGEEQCLQLTASL